MKFSGLISLIALACSALAAPAPIPVPEPAALEARAAATCGTKVYTAAAVNSASQRACTNWRGTARPGGYPHTFNNREGFSFAVAGPYIEFPIMSSGSLYTGGSPGPDRVVINANSGQQAGAITHTGASGNAFVKGR